MCILITDACGISSTPDFIMYLISVSYCCYHILMFITIFKLLYVVNYTVTLLLILVSCLVRNLCFLLYVFPFGSMDTHHMLH